MPSMSTKLPVTSGTRCTDERGIEVEVMKKGTKHMSFTVCLSRLKDTFFDEFSVRNHRAYTRNGLTKSRVLGVE